MMGARPLLLFPLLGRLEESLLLTILLKLLSILLMTVAMLYINYLKDVMVKLMGPFLIV